MDASGFCDAKKSTAKEVSEIRRMLTGMERTPSEDGRKRADQTSANRTVMDSILSGMQKQSESLRAGRQQAKDTSLSKKKLQYHFKNLSAQIIRSKTSQSARQVVSQASREVLKLKRDKMSGKYDSEEVEAAILHAQAMERVAKKKVRHLEEEELARAAGASYMGQEQAKGTEREEAERTFEYERTVEQTDSVSLRVEDHFDAFSVTTRISDEDGNAANMQGAGAEYTGSAEGDLSGAGIREMLSGMDDMMKGLSDLSAKSMGELTDQIMDAFWEGMQDLLEEMGLGDLSDALSMRTGDVDPEELKMVKIKHRIKEMKEIVEADSEYLKAIFEHLERMKNAGNLAGGLNGLKISPLGGFGAPVQGVDNPISQAGAAEGIASASAGGSKAAEPVIDVAL